METTAKTRESNNLIAAGQIKKRYQQPRLQVHGSVKHLTASGTLAGTENSGSKAMEKAGSDRILKECIVEIGRHSLGMGLYLFDYKAAHRDRWGHGRQFGVMADEVEAVLPEAVSLDPDGYRVVDYSKLGIRRTGH